LAQMCAHLPNASGATWKGPGVIPGPSFCNAARSPADGCQPDKLHVLV
jgi:hypothetical protein